MGRIRTEALYQRGLISTEREPSQSANYDKAEKRQCPRLNQQGVFDHQI
jgi:hypothetical protein